MHSLQEITEKKCEKNSFAPILPSHSIAKSAVKPIFSPLPHPTFFTPKSPFFALFPVLSPFSGDFSRNSARFLPCEAHFFLVFPHPDPKFWGFFEEYFAILPPPTAFSIHAPSPFTSLPHFLSLSSPLFHPPPHLTHDRAHPRAIRAYAYTRTHSHVRRFSFIAFTASPILRNPLGTKSLGVKENEKKPSQNAQQPHNQNINTKHPISSAVNLISSPR